MATATRYYTADGYYLPGANAPDLLQKKERLFQRLDRVHADLKKMEVAHQETDYGCLQSGKCCQVGLVLHNLELEHLARHLKERWKKDPSDRRKVINRLKASLEDDEWTMDSGIGDMMCAFFDEGCTIYPFRPSVCRMYGTIMELNDDCPRNRLASGREFIWVRPEADKTVRSLYRVVDDYGSLFPKADCSRYLPAGLLMFLLPKHEVDGLKMETRAKFWKTIHGYRSQFVPSTRQEPYEETVPRFPLKLRIGAAQS